MSGNRWRRLRSWLADRRNWKRIILPLIVVAALFIVGRLVDIDRYMQSVREWIWQFGPWGPVVYAGLYVAATLLLMPGTPFTVLAAFLFGTLWGFVTMVAATTLAAVIAFFTARYLARGAVEERLGSTEAFHRLREMVERNYRIAIPFIRLMPIFPFAINNYALGLTRISFWSYLLYSELVFLPMNAIIVLGAGFLYRATIKGEISWTLIGITTAAAFVVLGIGLIGKRLFEKPGSADDQG